MAAALLLSPSATSRARSRTSLVRINATTWRVLAASGRPLGNIAAVSEPEGVRYHAKVFTVSAGAYRLIGAFWSFEEARGCFATP